MAALRNGNLLEVLNLVPFGGVTLELNPVSARGVHGWSALSERVVRAWLEHVSRTQAFKFATGIAPIRSVCNVGAGAAQVIRQPLEFHRSGRSGGVLKGVSVGAAAFVRAVSCEALVGWCSLTPGRLLHHRVPGTHQWYWGIGYPVHTWGGAG